MAGRAFPRSGLYAITREGHASSEALAAAVAAAIRGGAVAVQYRAKAAANARAEAERLLAVCRAAGVPLIINDDLELAACLGADGVHLGRADADPLTARTRLGEDAIIGVSCYDDVARALRAAAVGASYVAFGRFFESATKPEATAAGLATLTEAKRHLSIPIVAIGGITAANAPPLLAAGADVLAVIGALFAGADPETEARRFETVFRR